MLKEMSCLSIRGISCALLSVAALAGCARVHPTPVVWVRPNRIVVKKASVPLPKQVVASVGLGQRPELLRAYRQFLIKGKAPNVRTDGFETVAYSPYTQPLVLCAPLHLCVLQLEAGEQVRTIHLGDSAHWVVSVSKTGGQVTSTQIVLKPRILNAVTDMVISTDRRLYTVGLISQAGAKTHVVSFYYPQATWRRSASKTAEALALKQGGGLRNTPYLHLNQLNFHYRILGRARWRPVRVFDDGAKTFIQMPPGIGVRDLPVLTLLRDKHTQLVNYRYRAPYYVLDGLFEEATLISGQGRHVKRVVIRRQARGGRG